MMNIKWYEINLVIKLLTIVRLLFNIIIIIVIFINENLFIYEYIKLVEKKFLI
jgi:hypothetical protein